MASDSKYLTGNPASIRDFVDSFDIFLFDCDGVLWSGDHVFDGAVQTLEKLKSLGKNVVFVTNNSTKSRAEYRKKLETMGIPATINEVFSSSYSSAIYISRILSLPPEKRTVFIIGEAGIESELRAENIRFIGGTDPTYQRPITSEDYEKLASGEALDKSVGVVLCGLDYHISYLKYAYAYHYLTQQGAVFLATNSDVSLPNNNTLFPGSGACAAPLVALLKGRQPETMGKPSQKMMDAVAEKFEFDRKKACMVGDRLDTDIKFGVEGGLGGTLCVMTGVTQSQADWEHGGSVKPTAWVDKLSDLNAGI